MNCFVFNPCAMCVLCVLGSQIPPKRFVLATPSGRRVWSPPRDCSPLLCFVLYFFPYCSISGIADLIGLSLVRQQSVCVYVLIYSYSVCMRLWEIKKITDNSESYKCPVTRTCHDDDDDAAPPICTINGVATTLIYAATACSAAKRIAKRRRQRRHKTTLLMNQTDCARGVPRVCLWTKKKSIRLYVICVLRTMHNNHNDTVCSNHTHTHTI